MAEPTSSGLDGVTDAEGVAATERSPHPDPGSATDTGGETVASPRNGDEEPTGPVIHDRRRLDPQTGRVRQAYADSAAPADAAGAAQPDDAGSPEDAGRADGAASGEPPELAAANRLAAERLEDLQRLNAEYVNYRKRVERDREVSRESAVAGMLEALLPVLDDVHLARQHGDLDDGPFAAIADKLETTLQRFGLERYGEVGEPFDPTVHEALMHTTAEGAEGATVTVVVQVMQPGYRAKERVLRPARVAVADQAG